MGPLCYDSIPCSVFLLHMIGWYTYHLAVLIFKANDLIYKFERKEIKTLIVRPNTVLSVHRIMTFNVLSNFIFIE